MSYFNAAEEICALDRNDPEFKEKVECIVKKAGHAEKFSVYSRIFLDLKYGPRNPRAFKRHAKFLIENFVKYKIETHKEFMGKPNRQQIYGYFDWKKKPYIPSSEDLNE